MCKKDKRSKNDYEESRYSDGKHYNKKHKNVEKKARNNIKTDLKKEFL